MSGWVTHRIELTKPIPLSVPSVLTIGAEKMTVIGISRDRRTVIVVREVPK